MIGVDSVETMRYKKGSRVEIWSNEEVPSGCWRCGEIIFGNGRSYTVRYEGYSGDANEKIVGRVNRRFIRPCPPHVEVKDDWVSGEVLEVFHDYSWKMATVCKVLGRNSFVVRLVGSSEDEFKVRKSHVRLRQCWLDDKWIVVGKVCSLYLNLVVVLLVVVLYGYHIG